MDKKYWFKLDKGKIKLQLKDLGRKISSNKNNYKKVLLVFLFFMLLGIGYAVFNEVGVDDTAKKQTGITVEELSSVQVERPGPVINNNPYQQDKEFSLDYNSLEENKVEREEDTKGKKPGEKQDQGLEDNVTGVVTESLKPMNEIRAQTLELLAPVSGQVLQEPGWYYHPVFDDWRYQHGIVLEGSKGDVVMAAEQGRVISVREDEYKGIMVTIQHDNGWETEYGHLQKTTLSPGERVVKGQEVGRLGATGLSEEPSLYFQLINAEGPIDPREYIK
ncbi:peptidoglycan DD-metalloendopeptidase family protein [Iocasia frigidifontis]|uniref:Peptidoglycan DD-metalloendopeptidase family protein n=1 Tax=Iocasia fonsfrigidae TaxID=2682810 RepID=A0A8A7KBF2_9FIRM|nr:M23 family metallopeptidase [Iocasia fonsfrigidae]QTL96878.1 peptidoglycan DD-metalloendopeptidase family protein [Iocasia fonsfrigidae]